MESHRSNKEFVVGFMINPYQPAAHAYITKIERKGQYYDVSMTQGYRDYRARVYALPNDCHQGIYRYSLDAWSSYFGLRIRDIHPKWYAYDLISTRDLSSAIVARRFMVFSSDFLGIRVVRRDGRQVNEIYDGTPNRAVLPSWRSLVFRTWTTYDHITADIERVLIIPLEIESSVQDESVYLKWPSGVVRQVLVKGLSPLEPTIFRRASVFYEILRSPDPGLGVEMVRLSLPIFREYCNFQGSYVDDINIVNMTQYSYVNAQGPRINMNLRSYLMEPDLRMCPDLTIDHSVDSVNLIDDDNEKFDSSLFV